MGWSSFKPPDHTLVGYYVRAVPFLIVAGGGNGFFSDPPTPTFFFKILVKPRPHPHIFSHFSLIIMSKIQVFDPTPTFFSHLPKFLDPTPTFCFANPFPPPATIKNGTALTTVML